MGGEERVEWTLLASGHRKGVSIMEVDGPLVTRGEYATWTEVDSGIECPWSPVLKLIEEMNLNQLTG